ncbi:TetR/AcrR family transcriptional regulator [Ponticoccus alexandrii]|uniref:TetR family transcriptional regulator n=1 Tax=Ponticoccus alexandrii TaxID=1943633 RepID=A0ABX7F6M0_9RHOB|nr:TetR/AcrR family transcriptional regulator [Ponticoccus alexandrii]ETA52363.1 TetR family transcriptional regulator [Rhodobacteraceae bacterium PD-2]QRF65846.1 TetR family transcriptional regulator [Ponticoccus alexandrii]
MARTQGSHAEITGPKIRTEALRLFAESGYAAVSMREIARAVGVQAGALYNYTPDKQALLFSLLKGHMDDLAEALSALPRAAAPMERLQTFVHFHIAFHLERPQAVFIAYMELRNLTPENFAVIEAQRRDYETGLEEILRAGMATGAFSVPDSKLATLAIIAMLTGVTTWYRPGGRLPLKAVQDRYWDLTRQMVTA